MKVGRRTFSLCFLFPSRINSLLISYTHFLSRLFLGLELSLKRFDSLDGFYWPKIRELTDMCFKGSSLWRDLSKEFGLCIF